MKIKQFLISAIIFIVIDFFYLQLIKQYFSQQIFIVQKKPMQINLIGMILCYLFIVCGINYFIIDPNKTIMDAFLFGILIYGVYETTNYTLFSDWSILTVLIDTIWGGLLFALTTYLVQLISK
jgi:uncharacterized membrane protein